MQNASLSSLPRGCCNPDKQVQIICGFAMGQAASTNVLNSPSEEECHTELKVTNFNFSWTVKNFSFFQNAKIESLQSSTFSTTDNGNSKWCLILSLKDNEVGRADRISLFLRLVSSTKSEIFTKVTLSLLNKDKQKFNVSSFDHIYKHEREDCGFVNFIQRSNSETNELYTAEAITIDCALNIIDSEYSVIKSSLPIFKIPPSQLSEHLENLLDSQEHSDIVLCANKKEFHCHKAILACRSPVFSAMFKHNMQEKEMNRVVITDIDEKVLKELLCFMYTGKTPEAGKMTADLLIAADKYNVHRLKIICEEALSFTLSVGTSVSLLKLADKYNADKLKCATIQFIVKNAIPVMGSKEWEDMVHEYPDLIIDVSRCLDETKSRASNNS